LAHTRLFRQSPKTTRYQQKFHVANPNLKLISELKRVGVMVAVLGQALAEHHMTLDWLGSNVTLALSSLTTVTRSRRKAMR
jgi:hypothetical protein